MQEYQFIGTESRFYTQIDGLPASLTVSPGDTHSFVNPPTDGLWVQVQTESAVAPSEDWFKESTN